MVCLEYCCVLVVVIFDVITRLLEDVYSHIIFVLGQEDEKKDKRASISRLNQIQSVSIEWRFMVNPVEMGTWCE